MSARKPTSGVAVRFFGVPPSEHGRPQGTVNGMRWCNPHAHALGRHARTGSLLSSLARSLSPSLLPPRLSRLLPASSCEKWARLWARGDGATPPLSPYSPPARLAAASQGPPLIIRTRGMVQRTVHIGRISLRVHPNPPHPHAHNTPSPRTTPTIIQPSTPTEAQKGEKT